MVAPIDEVRRLTDDQVFALMSVTHILDDGTERALRALAYTLTPSLLRVCTVTKGRGLAISSKQASFIPLQCLNRELKSYRKT
jgi:hypothetical protein